MPTITSAGIGSGLDVNGIIDGLMAIERRPLEIIQFRREQVGVRISAYGELLSAVSAFQSEVDKLNSSSALDIFDTSSSDEDVVLITATDNPAAGSYAIEVTRLAEAHKLASDEFSSSDTFGGTAGDEITIQVGAGPDTSITIDLSSAMTLEAIRDAINTDDANPGLTASVINGDGGNQKLVVTADDTGSDNEITFAYGGSIDKNTFDFDTVNDIGGNIDKLDAAFIVDGYDITRPTNEIADVIEGITFSLQGENPGSTVRISVGRDDSAVENQVQAFASAYNNLMETVRGLRSGSLASDNILLSLENQVKSIFNTPPSSGTYSSLADVGLSLQREGNMQLDAEVFQSAMNEDIAAVTELFAAEGTGFAYRLSVLADRWVGSDGLISSRTDTLNGQVDSLSDRQLNIERNLELVETRYRAQFSALDTLVSQFQNTSQFLTTQLAQLSSLRLDNS